MRSRDRYLNALSITAAVWFGATATLAWLSYGDATRRIIASSYPQLGWLAPRPEPIAHSASETTGLAAPAVSFPDQQRLNAMSLDLEAIRQTADRIALTQQQITRKIDEFITSLDQMTRNIDQLTAGQDQMTRNVDQLTASHDQMMDGITKLQAIEQQILHRNPEPAPRPAPTLARNPVRRSSLGPAVR